MKRAMVFLCAYQTMMQYLSISLQKQNQSEEGCVAEIRFFPFSTFFDVLLLLLLCFVDHEISNGQ